MFWTELRGPWVVCICSLYVLVRMLQSQKQQQQELGIWSARRRDWCHLHHVPPPTHEELSNAADTSHTWRYTQLSSSPVDTLISTNGIWKSYCFFSFGKTCMRKGFIAERSFHFAFRKEMSLFLCEAQSEGPQGADFQLPSNSYTFTLALTPAPPDHIRQWATCLIISIGSSESHSTQTFKA